MITSHQACQVKGFARRIHRHGAVSRILADRLCRRMGEMLELDGGIAVILMQAGMHCVGCPSSIGESLEEACMVHGLDADVVLANINEYLSSRNA